MSIPDILKKPDTEPEAAHLRSVLRRVLANINGPPSRVEEIISKALERPCTNGAVINALLAQNGDLRSQVMRLEDMLQSARRDAIATHEGLRRQIEELKCGSSI